MSSCITFDPDTSNNSSSVTTTVVLTPERAIERTIDTIVGLELDKGTENSLVSSLTNALKSLEKGNKKSAGGQLGALINKVESQSGKKISDRDAATLVALVQKALSKID